VGASLLAMASVQSKKDWLNNRYREQARSHIGFHILQIRVISGANKVWGYHCAPPKFPI
jgi:hypothetical protein